MSDETLRTRILILRVGLIHTAAIFVVGALVVEALAPGNLWLLVLFGGAVLFLLMDNALAADGWSRAFFNLWPGIDIKTKDRAVSPVVGVILMVAVTVILAAVVGTFVFNMGQEASENTPQATFDYTYDGTNVTIKHTGGDTIAGHKLTVVVDGTPHPWGNGSVSAGTTTAHSAQSGELIEVVWEGDSGTSIISEYRVP